MNEKVKTMNEIKEYSNTKAALEILCGKYKGVVYSVETTKGMANAKAARAEVRGYRVDLEKMRKELKTDVLERGRMIDGEAKRITIELEALENPIDEQIKTEENRKEAERRAKEEAERVRVESIKARLGFIAAYPVEYAGCPSFVIAGAIQDLEGIGIDGYEEFTGEAVVLKERVLQTLGGLLDKAERQEAQAAELKKARAELEAQRALSEAIRRQEEWERKIREETFEAELRELRKAEEAKLKAEREAQKAEIDRQRMEQARADAEAKERREAQEAVERAERERKEAGEKALREAERERQIEAERAGNNRKLREKLEAIEARGDLSLHAKLMAAYQLGRSSRD